LTIELATALLSYLGMNLATTRTIEIGFVALNARANLSLEFPRNNLIAEPVGVPSREKLPANC
jgi:hypothetical protein